MNSTVYSTAVKVNHRSPLDKSMKFGTHIACGIYFQIPLDTHRYLNGVNLNEFIEIHVSSQP